MEKARKNGRKKIKRILSVLLVIAILVTSVGLEQFVSLVKAETPEVVIYLKDTTENQ